MSKLERGATNPDQGPSEELKRAAEAMEAQGPPEESREKQLNEFSQKLEEVEGLQKMAKDYSTGKLSSEPDEDTAEALKRVLSEVESRDKEKREDYDRRYGASTKSEQAKIDSDRQALRVRSEEMGVIKWGLDDTKEGGLKQPKKREMPGPLSPVRGALKKFLDEQARFLRGQIDKLEGESEGKE